MALTWFDTEHLCLLAAQQTAITYGWHQSIWELAWAMNTFHSRRGRLHDQLAVWLAGLAAAHQLSTAQQSHANTVAHQSLGYAYARLGHHDEAHAHLRKALAQAGHEEPDPRRTSTGRSRGTWDDRGSSIWRWSTPAAPETSTANSTAQSGKLKLSTTWLGCSPSW